MFSISSLNSVESLISYHPCPSIARWLQECAFLTHSNPVPRCRGSQKPGNCLWVCLCVFLFGFVGVIGSLSFCVFDTLCVWESIMEPWIILHFPFAYELPTPNILHSYSCHIYKMHSSESTSAKEVETKTRSTNIENTIPNNLKAIKPTDLCQIVTSKLGHDPSTTKTRKIVLLWCDRLYTEIKTKNI